MRLKFMEEKFLIIKGIDECSSLVQEALNELGLKKVTVRKEVRPRYLLLDYSPGWVGKDLEVEFVFKESQNGTEVSVKWPYTEEVPPSIHDRNLLFYQQHGEERKQKIKRLLSEFKKRVGAIDVPATGKKNENSMALSNNFSQ
jgi:hypothetical protein